MSSASSESSLGIFEARKHIGETLGECHLTFRPSVSPVLAREGVRTVGRAVRVEKQPAHMHFAARPAQVRLRFVRVHARHLGRAGSASPWSERSRGRGSRAPRGSVCTPTGDSRPPSGPRARPRHVASSAGLDRGGRCRRMSGRSISGTSGDTRSDRLGGGSPSQRT